MGNSYAGKSLDKAWGMGSTQSLLCPVWNVLQLHLGTWTKGELSMHHVLSVGGRQTACHCLEGQSWGTKQFTASVGQGTQEMRHRQSNRLEDTNQACGQSENHAGPLYSSPVS